MDFSTPMRVSLSPGLVCAIEPVTSSTIITSVLLKFSCASHSTLIGISVDGTWCHAAFAANRKLHFPLLSDFEPKGAVARAYGAYRPVEGTTERALFVIDEQGLIHWSYLSPVGVNPGADGILEALESLSKRRVA